MLAQRLNVLDVMVHVDARPVDAVLARVGRAAASRALVEEDRSVARRIERAPNPRRAAGPWPAVEVYDWDSVRRPDLFPVEDVAATDIESASRKRLRVLLSHSFSLLRRDAGVSTIRERARFGVRVSLAPVIGRARTPTIAIVMTRPRLSVHR